ncbi:hypothetical protein [Streptomyces sp. NPDC088350]|uniref:hypothetical protein n=1 Tax=Streptomyces sp. NPDC088350 TaxID=3365854 RepID=UPI003801F2E5
MTDTTEPLLPDGFTDLEPYVPEWALPTRQERYATRLSKTLPELTEFYDAVAPRAEEAIGHLNGQDIHHLPEPAGRLLRLLYSMILVSYAVNVFEQPRIPDSGAAFFDTTAEPAV